MPSGKDDFPDGCSSPHVVVKLRALGLAAWVSGSPSPFTSGKRQKKGDTILDTAAQHLLNKCCRASAAVQTTGRFGEVFSPEGAPGALI